MESFENLTLLNSVKKMPVMSLPVRTVVAQLSSGNVLISPGSMLSEQQLRAVSGITDLVANNGFHNAGMPQARKLFPHAKAWGPPGSSYPHILSEQTWPHQSELPMVLIEGLPKINEVVFIHRESRTLICADLVFNMNDAEGVGTWIILNMFGTWRRFAVSKFFLKSLKDKPALERSLTKLFSHDFDNVLMAHGAPLLGGGREALLKAFAERDLKPS